MELRSMRYFVQVADEGSITRAADKLGVAQPALTRHLKRLEASLGTQLLMRLPRGVRLTTSGREFLEHARRITFEAARARTLIQAGAKTARGRVDMGTSPTLAPCCFPVASPGHACNAPPSPCASPKASARSCWTRCSPAGSISRSPPIRRVRARCRSCR